MTASCSHNQVLLDKGIYKLLYNIVFIVSGKKEVLLCFVYNFHFDTVSQSIV